MMMWRRSRPRSIGDHDGNHLLSGSVWYCVLEGDLHFICFLCTRERRSEHDCSKQQSKRRQSHSSSHFHLLWTCLPRETTSTEQLLATLRVKTCCTADDASRRPNALTTTPDRYCRVIDI